MDSSHHLSRNNPVAISDGSQPANKRPLATVDEPLTKKIRPSVEVPAVYSDAVRKKLASTSRTGQACDRCKERKMKCDTNPVACQPCRQKNLRCYTTDRVTGQSRERGQTDRAETELQSLREENAAYRRKYGPLNVDDGDAPSYSPAPEPSVDRSEHLQHPPERDKADAECPGNFPSSKYVGWPAPSHIETLHNGPICGTNVDLLDGIVDIADFPCELMEDYPVYNLNTFNMSKTSVMNTLTGYQVITDPRLPSKEQALQDANAFLIIMSQYVPIVHRPSFIQMIHRIYDQPSMVNQAERVQLAVVLASVELQTGTRNHREAAVKFELAHHHIHYALTCYRELLREKSLASMQALALILMYFRNLPKPAATWGFGHSILIKAIESDYHRDPDKIELPPSENNILCKELRKRVFHSILGICITTGARVGRLIPWQFSHMDVPLPMAIRDSELSEKGLITPLSGSCEFWPCIQLAKLVPLLIEMYNHVTSVRRSEKDYLKTIEVLHGKIDAWRRDWDESIRHEDKQPNLTVATLLVEQWAAEYALNLYHPSLYPTRTPEVMDRHLEICHKQALRLLKSFHILSGKYKGADFTWHSMVAYALAFGVTLHVYQRKKLRMSASQLDSMKTELKGWMSLVAYADQVLRTKNYLQHIFEPRVRRLEAECQDLIQSATSEPIHYHPVATPTSSSLPSRTLVKPDPSPQPSPPTLIPNSADVRPSQAPQDMAMSQFSQTHAMPSSQQWSHSGQHVTHAGNVAPSYATYASNPPQYSALPTSLAPLLNEQAGNYMTYPPANTSLQNEMMMFHPAHYTDSPATMMWPLITLPQQDHGQQHNLNGHMKYS